VYLLREQVQEEPVVVEPVAVLVQERLAVLVLLVLFVLVLLVQGVVEKEQTAHLQIF
jgi:hypothetical protein